MFFPLRSIPFEKIFAFTGMVQSRPEQPAAGHPIKKRGKTPRPATVTIFVPGSNIKWPPSSQRHTCRRNGTLTNIGPSFYHFSFFALEKKERKKRI
jgi:hypothetical protein